VPCRSRDYSPTTMWEAEGEVCFHVGGKRSIVSQNEGSSKKKEKKRKSLETSSCEAGEGREKGEGNASLKKEDWHTTSGKSNTSEGPTKIFFCHTERVACSRKKGKELLVLYKENEKKCETKGKKEEGCYRLSQTGGKEDSTFRRVSQEKKSYLKITRIGRSVGGEKRDAP